MVNRRPVHPRRIPDAPRPIPSASFTSPLPFGWLASRRNGFNARFDCCLLGFSQRLGLRRGQRLRLGLHRQRRLVVRPGCWRFKAVAGDDDSPAVQLTGVGDCLQAGRVYQLGELLLTCELRFCVWMLQRDNVLVLNARLRRLR